MFVNEKKKHTHTIFNIRKLYNMVKKKFPNNTFIQYQVINFNINNHNTSLFVFLSYMVRIGCLLT